MKRLAILGASGHGKVAADCAQECGWDEIVFFDDFRPTGFVNGHWRVEGNTSDLLKMHARYDGLIVAIGDNRVREEKIRVFLHAGASLATLVHPRAAVSRYAALGTGSVVFAGAIINVDVRIGLGAIINTGATVDHDCVLGDAVHISPGAHLAGGVKVGHRTWVGIGASIRQLTEIGNDVMVGAGAAVVSRVPDGLTVVGVPARPLVASHSER